MHLSLLHLSAGVKNVAMNTGLRLPVHIPAFTSSVCIPGRAIAGSNGNSTFTVQRIHHPVFHSSWTIILIVLNILRPGKIQLYTYNIVPFPSCG